MEVDCFVDGLFASRAAVPSGASTGSYEAVELRDHDKSRYSLSRQFSQFKKITKLRLKLELQLLPLLVLCSEQNLIAKRRD